MNDGAIAQNRARHRRGECQAAHRGSFAREPGDDFGIGGAFLSGRADDDARIASCLLIASHGLPAKVSERVEPVERKEGLNGHVGDEVAATVMSQFMRQRQIARSAVGPGHEVHRQRHHLVENAECHGPIGCRAFDQTHRPGLSYRTRSLQKFMPHFEIQRIAPHQEYCDAHEPDHQQRALPVENNVRLGRYGHRRLDIGKSGGRGSLDCHARFTLHGFEPRGQNQRRHRKASHRQ